MLVFYKGWLYAAINKGNLKSEDVLWRYNPVTGDTMTIKTHTIRDLCIHNDRLYFLSDSVICEYDGVSPVKLIDTLKSTANRVYYPLASLNGKVYYTKQDSNVYEYDPLTGNKKIAFTHAATQLTNPIWGGVELNNRLYFSAHHPNSGTELWEWDGFNLPKLVADLYKGPMAGSPLKLRALSHGLYFAGCGDSHFFEMHRFKPYPATVHNRSFEGEVRIYPNPATSAAVLELQLRTAMTLSVVLYDTEGRQLFTSPQVLYSQGTGRVELDIRHLPAGNYFYHVRNNPNATVVSGKLIKL